MHLSIEQHLIRLYENRAAVGALDKLQRISAQHTAELHTEGATSASETVAVIDKKHGDLNNESNIQYLAETPLAHYSANLQNQGAYEFMIAIFPSRLLRKHSAPPL